MLTGSMFSSVWLNMTRSCRVSDSHAFLVLSFQATLYVYINESTASVVCSASMHVQVCNRLVTPSLVGSAALLAHHGGPHWDRLTDVRVSSFRRF